MSGFEIPNHDIKSIVSELNSNKFLDYRTTLFDIQKYDLGVGINPNDNFNVKLTNINSYVHGVFCWLSYTIPTVTLHNDTFRMHAIELVNSSEVNVNNFTY